MKKLLAAASVAALIGASGAAFAAEFTEVDVNADGAVSLDEYLIAMPESDQSEFEAADADGDMMLNETELATIEEAGDPGVDAGGDSASQ